MRWQDFLIKIASSTAGAAAGAATLPAGGPIVAAAARAAADKSMEALLSEFVLAQNDQLDRIEAINQDMQCRLIRLEQGMSDLLDEPWRTARLHIQEAANSPGRFNEDITEARKLLLKAYTISRDDLRSSWIAQELAAVYALSDDVNSVRRWLASAYESGLKGLKNQIWQAAEGLESEIQKQEQAYEKWYKHLVRTKQWPWGDLPYGVCSIQLIDGNLSPKPGPFKRTRNSRDGFANTEMVRRLVQGLEGLFNDLAQLWRACIGAGIDKYELPLPHGYYYEGMRVTSFVTGGDFDTASYFDVTLAPDPQSFDHQPIDVWIMIGELRSIEINYSLKIAAIRG